MFDERPAGRWPLRRFRFLIADVQGPLRAPFHLLVLDEACDQAAGIDRRAARARQAAGGGVMEALAPFSNSACILRRSYEGARLEGRGQARRFETRPSAAS